MALLDFKEVMIEGLLQNKSAVDSTENEEKGNLNCFLNSLAEIFYFVFSNNFRNVRSQKNSWQMKTMC